MTYHMTYPYFRELVIQGLRAEDPHQLLQGSGIKRFDLKQLYPFGHRKGLKQRKTRMSG